VPNAKNPKVDYKIVEFVDQAVFRVWLAKNGKDVPGIWLRIYKKDSEVATVTYAQAVDEALCYGWIDGQKKSYDELSFLQKFTPRRARSMWSKTNIANVERLTSAGLMTDAGLQQVHSAQADGRWAAAYDKPSEMQVPKFFLDMLKQHPKALAFYKELNKANIYAITWRLQTAKTEATRQKRAEKLIAMLEAGRKLH
jgi:uncharacterized protein YdeI (YjbR/CyaY-like superfamily)